MAIVLPVQTVNAQPEAIADGQGIFNTVAGYEPSPFDHPEIWNSINVNGYTWDQASGGGYILVRRAKRAFKWDNKNPAGQIGQNQNFRGLNFPQFELVFHFWDTSGWNYWQFYSKAVFLFDVSKLPPGVAPPAVNVYHPSLAALSISALIIHDCGAAEPLNEGGEFRATVTVEEFKPIVLKAVFASPVLSNTIPTVTITGFVLTPAEVQANAALTQALGVANNGLPQPVGPWNPSQGGLPL
jgi:hypothetical protein